MTRRTCAVALLPPVAPRWPSPLLLGHRKAASDAAAPLARIRARSLWWPAPRARATRPRVAVFGDEALAAARAGFDDADIAAPAHAADVDPERLEAVFAPDGAGPGLWAALGGVSPGRGDETALAVLIAARGVSPWTGAAMDLDEAVEAQALLRAAAMRARGPVRLVGMSPWKRACLRPFLTGPDGPPQRARRADPPDAPRAVWGVDVEAPESALRVEDGFLRSVGLGIQHAPPISLAIDARPPHFDATRPNAFEACVAEADLTPTLLARAAVLRTRIRDLKLTKYNVGAEALEIDAPSGRERVLVAGQTANDASIRLGATAVRDDAALLRAARARFPGAFLLYKPHPDTWAGRRPGRARDEVAAASADAVAAEASAEAALGWAERVATITSSIGFEALLRGVAVTTFGRPFYSGWGLTDDADPPKRNRDLSLDELTAAALILLPSYVDPATGLPASPEIALDALAAERDRARTPRGRLERVRRAAVSAVLRRL